MARHIGPPPVRPDNLASLSLGGRLVCRIVVIRRKNVPIIFGEPFLTPAEREETAAWATPFLTVERHRGESQHDAVWRSLFGKD